MRIITEPVGGPPTVRIALEQDGNEVNILVNGSLVAWFAEHLPEGRVALELATCAELDDVLLVKHNRSKVSP